MDEAGLLPARRGRQRRRRAPPAASAPGPARARSGRRCARSPAPRTGRSAAAACSRGRRRRPAASAAAGPGELGASPPRHAPALQQLAGAVGRAHEGRRDHGEPQRGAPALVALELLRRDVPGHRQAAGVRLQVLADGHGVHAGRGGVGEHVGDLRRRLAEAHHEAGLDERAGGRARPAGAAAPRGACSPAIGPRRARPRGGAREQLERALVARLRPHLRVQARDGLEVVVQHVGAGGEDGAQRRFVAAQVRDEHLDGRRRRRGADGGDGRRELRRAAVRQVVARDAGDDDVPQAEAPGGLGDPARLVLVERADARVHARRPCPRPPPRRSGTPACTRRRGSGTSPCRRRSTRPCWGSAPRGRRCAGRARRAGRRWRGTAAAPAP